MDIFQSTVLGIVQGLGEFLPISSTAHLILIPYFFGWPDPGLSFDVALHVGTLIAVIAFFWQDWLEIFKSASNNYLRTNYPPRVDEQSSLRVEAGKLQTTNYKPNFLWLLIIASIPGAFFGFLFDDYAEYVFRNPLLIASTLSIVGLALYLADKYMARSKDISHISLKDAVVIGLSQAVAIIPGISRSGATMAAGLARGLSREQAAKFSFLLSTPIILGAAILKIPQLFKNGVTLPITLGIIIAAVSGYLAIKYMLHFVQKIGYASFFWYRLALALIITIVYFIRV